MTQEQWEIIQEVRADVKELLAWKNRIIGMQLFITAAFSIFGSAACTYILSWLKLPH